MIYSYLSSVMNHLIIMSIGVILALFLDF